MDTTAMYREARIRMTELARQAGDGVGERPVPPCPEWTVRELFAHTVGVVDDILNARLDGVGSDPWTAVQVAARADRSLDEVLAEWDETGPRVEAVFGEGGAPAQLVFDLSTHEHDLRSALDRPGARDAGSSVVAVEWVTDAWREALRSGYAPLRLRAGDLTIESGDEPGTTVDIEPFEALRALTGRRSLGQIRAYDWDGDPSPWLPAFTWGPFRPRPTDLIE